MEMPSAVQMPINNREDKQLLFQLFIDIYSVTFKGLFSSMTTEKVKTLSVDYCFHLAFALSSCYFTNNSHIIIHAETM